MQLILTIINSTSNSKNGTKQKMLILIIALLENISTLIVIKKAEHYHVFPMKMKKSNLLQAELNIEEE